MNIPKRIITIWLNENEEIPELFKKCIESHNIEGYEHHLITLENNLCIDPYYEACIKAKNWVKACDYLRIYYLNMLGGIYLDADMEVIEGNNFDELLNNKLFVCKEENGFLANSVIGSVEENPVLKNYLRRVADNFNPDGDMVFEPGMRLFCDMVYALPESERSILPAEYFFPYNHQTGEYKITNNTICIHHFAKSWIK